ncbi:LAETG motif-containing sortase-dependent surface protein [Kitasatospora sp. NPDC057500]|uniref:LAETG motif-containing sortase-dependent surface protein n=1 Tax=Kitasatospora sp. NPDC057500 TaxID=3346151 RepID=UPI00369DFA58
MRSSRLLAASTLLALSLGTTVGAATAGASPVVPTPTPSATATDTPSATPSATPTPTGTPTGSPTGTPSASASPSASATPSATATPSTKPTGRPSAPTTAPGFTCSGGVYQGYDWLKATGTGLWNRTIAPGETQETSVTWENLSGVDLPNFHTYLYLAANEREDGVGGYDWNKDYFAVQFRAPGQDWKPIQLNDHSADTGFFRLGKGEKLTLHFRITPTDKAPLGSFGGNFGGGDTAMPNTALPHPAQPDKDGCTQYINYYEGAFKLTRAGATGAASASTSTKPATSPSVSPSAVSGPHLAETGSSSNTLPIAVGGAVVLAAGAGTLLALRRRKAGAHG